VLALDRRPSVAIHDLAAGAGEAQKLWDRTKLSRLAMSIACGASKKVDIT